MIDVTQHVNMTIMISAFAPQPQGITALRIHKIQIFDN